METETEPEADVTVNKNVTIVAYLRNQDVGLREAADAILEDVDMLDTYLDETTKRYFRAGPVDERIFDDEEWHQLKSMSLGDAKLVEETETEEKFNESINKLAKRIFSDTFPSDPGLLPEGCSFGFSNRYIKNEDGDTVMSVNRLADTIPMVMHPSELEGDEENPYEDEEEEWNAVKYKVRMNDIPLELSEKLNDAFVEIMVSNLGSHRHISRVRWLDCEVSQTESGVCYNV